MLKKTALRGASLFVLFTKFPQGDQIKIDNVGGECKD
jgi:hypothetical protein